MYELITEIGADRKVQITLPESIQTPCARIIILPMEPEEDPMQWSRAIGREWYDELADERQDIYTLEDGEPLDAKRRDLLGELSLRGYAHDETSPCTAANPACIATIHTSSIQRYLGSVSEATRRQVSAILRELLGL